MGSLQLLLFLRASPRYQKAFSVPFNHEKQPEDPAALKQATANLVLVCVKNLRVHEGAQEMSAV
jgi:hypothetical protein